jgi:hypothetical protein
MLKKSFVFSHKNHLHNQVNKSSVCANEKEPQNANGPVVVRLTTIRFTGTVSTDGDLVGGSEGRTALLAPTASTPLRVGYLALP